MKNETKFNLGDKVFAIDKKTTKVTEFEVEAIYIFVREEGTSIRYKAKGTSMLEPDYDEDKCFATKEELIDYITTPEFIAEQ